MSDAPALKRPRDSKATKKLLLKAAATEFAEYGLAGARVDRIAGRSGVNKRLIYVYFGDKDQLFDAVTDEHAALVAEAIPLPRGDLRAFAAARYDFMLANPEVRRIAIWRSFERSEPTRAERNGFRERVDAVAAAQREGRVRADIPAVDLFAIVLRMTESWLSAPPGLKAVSGEDPMSAGRLRAHRSALLAAVQRVIEPGAATPACYRRSGAGR